MSTDGARRKRVVFITAILTQYRAPLHEAIRTLLAREGVDYELVYSAPKGEAAQKGDTVDLPWATKVPAFHLKLFGRSAIWQRIGARVRGADLVILQEGNKVLRNYPLLAARRLGLAPPLAFFGHGRNFQEARRTLGERLKRIVSRQVDFWFAYTEQSARALVEIGVPERSIAVFNNAIDTRRLRDDLKGVTQDEVEALKAGLSLRPDAPIGLFIGALYTEKRLGFLLEAADLIFATRPDFALVIAGDGPDRKLLEGDRPYLRVLGPRFGKDKAVLLKAADLILMPGAIGLVVLDAFCAGLPLVTTQLDQHGPEFAYLSDGIEGVVTPDPKSAPDYARAVLALIADPGRRQAMSVNAARAADRYSIESAAERVANGIFGVLGIETSPSVAG